MQKVQHVQKQKGLLHQQIVERAVGAAQSCDEGEGDGT